VPPARVLAGRYQLKVPLGRGAFGEVWRATDVTTRRSVAVKIVQLGEIPDAPRLAEVIARFRLEAITAGQLQHPNIVAAYEAGRVANELFLAMELVEGVSLAQVIEQRLAAGIGLLPIPALLDLAEQVSAGLAAAHEAGIVHRDVKPSNLMVTPRLHAKIIDFGLVRLLTDKAPRLTAPGLAIGTPVYMSPEQAAAIDVDSRADLYSFGCVLYELVAGEPPFTGDTPEALLMMQLHGQPVPLSMRRADLPPGLEQLIDELMSKDRESRPRNAQLVNHRIREIRAVLPNSEPVYEADRGTLQTADQTQVPRLAATKIRTTTIADVQRDGDRVDHETVLSPEAGGATVLTPESLAALIRPSGVASPADDVTEEPPSAAAAGGSTRWPTPPPRRPKRRRWRAAASTFVTAAIIGAVAVILWQRAHDQLKVTAVAVAPAQPPGNRCNITVSVVGTIETNGHGGTVSYEWIRSGGFTSPVSAVTAASGHAPVRVYLRWTFRGSGTYHAGATLRVLTPGVASGHTSFTYACTG
jgi:serine/threonine protein kinase